MASQLRGEGSARGAWRPWLHTASLLLVGLLPPIKPVFLDTLCSIPHSFSTFTTSLLLRPLLRRPDLFQLASHLVFNSS